MTSVAAEADLSRHTVFDAVILAATIIVVAVLGTSCAAAGPAGAGHRSASTAPSPAVTGAEPAPAGGVESLDAVAALSTSDAWVVGTHRPKPKGIYALTKHWDGQRWTTVPCPSPGGTAHPNRSLLAAVAIDAPDDAWAVGQWSPMRHDPPTYGLIEHWNGTKWTLVPAPRSSGHVTDLSLTAVAATSPTAAWAIGRGVSGGHFVTVFIAWNGTRWRYLPRPGGTLVGGLAVISPRDIWVVGTRVAKSAPRDRTLAEHWNGSTWKTVPTPNGFKGRPRSSGLSAVSGSSASNVWAVGDYQSGPTGTDTRTLVERWNGARWQVQPSPNGPSGAQGERGLSAVAALSRTSALAVGSYGAGKVLPLTERWNGARWTTVPNKLSAGVTFAYLTTVAAVNPGYAWAIGDGDKGSFIEKWNGTTWLESYQAQTSQTPR
jgi:hypothetical protein